MREIVQNQAMENADENHNPFQEQSEPGSEREEISVSYHDIPLYLRTSAFYLSLCADDENAEVSIPRTCFKMDDTVDNVDDLGQLLRVVIFWGIDMIPNSVLDFCGRKDVSLWQGVTSSFAQDCNIHKSLTEYFKKWCVTDWFVNDSFAAAVNSGRMELIEHWMGRNPVGEQAGKEAAQYAAERGHLEALQILHANAYPLQFVDCAGVAEKGHTECLKYVLDNGAAVDENCCYAAAKGGHLECLRYLIKSDCPRGDEEKLRELTAQGSHSDCYRYLSSPHDFEDLVVSSSNDDDDNESFHNIYRLKSSLIELQMLRDNGAVWDESVSLAALYRDLPFLQYVMHGGCPHTNDMVLRAAAMTREDAAFFAKLQFLVEDMLLPTSNELFTIAVMYGSVDAVQYLVDVGCPCEFVSLPYSLKFSLDDTCVLESMEYATQHGWSLNDAFLYIVHNNHLPICQANFPYPSEDFVAVDIVGRVRDWDNLEAAALCVAAARNQYLRLINLVKRAPKPTDITLLLAIIHGSVECVIFLVYVGYPCVFELSSEFMMPNNLDDTRIARCLEHALKNGVARNGALYKFVFGNHLRLCQAVLIRPLI